MRVSVLSILIIFNLLCPRGYAKMEGRKLADSLKTELKKSKDDTNKVNILNRFVVAYKDIDPDSSIPYSTEAMLLAARLSWQKGMADADMSLGYAYRLKTDFPATADLFEKGLQVSQLNGYKAGVAAAQKQLAGLYMDMSDFHKALQYYKDELKTDEANGNKLAVAVALGNIALVYYNLSDYPTAIDYNAKAIAASEEIGDKYGVATVSWNLGELYQKIGSYTIALPNLLKALNTFEEIGEKNVGTITSEIGLVYNDLGDRTKAVEYLSRSLKIAEEYGDKNTLANCLQNFGGYYQLNDSLVQALPLFIKSLALFEEQKDKNGILSVTMNLGNLYASQGSYVVAVQYLDTSYQIASSIGDRSQEAAALQSIGYLFYTLYKDSATAKRPNPKELPHAGKAQGILIPAGKTEKLQMAFDYLKHSELVAKQINAWPILKDVCGMLADVYQEKGDYKNAFEYHKRYTALKDSLASTETHLKMTRLLLERDADRKIATTEKNAALSVQKQRVYTYAGVAGILFLAGFSFFIVKERRKSERERKKSDALLLNILPAEVAAELKTQGHTTAKQYDNVTVLFADFVNFTGASERMTAQALVDELDTCFKAFDAITEKYNVEKIKTIGDAYLAVAGLPVPDARHAENAVLAATDILAFMTSREAKLGTKTFEIRIGMHTGSVVAGIVGTKKFAYDIWGDTVNTAARMQQSGAPGRINISETTFELVKGKIHCTFRGEIEAKNKGWLKMYYVG